MPDHQETVPNPLSSSQVRQWILDIGNDLITRADIETMQDLESWTLDAEGTTFITSLLEIGEWLHKDRHAADIVVSEEDMRRLIQVLAYANFPRSMRLMSLIGQRQPGFVGDLTLTLMAHITSDDPEIPDGLRAEANIVLQRLRMIYRRRLYERIFSPERRRALLEILEQKTHSPSEEMPRETKIA